MDLIVREESPKKISLFLHCVTIIMVGFLSYSNYTQDSDITALDRMIRSYDQINREQAKNITELGELMKALDVRQRILQKQLQVQKLIVKRDLKNQNVSVEQRLADLSNMLIQMDQSLANVEQHMTYEAFKYKKNKTEAIIRSNFTIESIRDDYDYYTHKFYSSLDNIKNPLYDPIELANFTSKINEIREEQYHKYQRKYKIDDFPIEMSMCVVVPTFNNVRGLRYVYNIQSILNQNYTNYLVVILDDGSSDKTGILIERYLRRRKIGSDKVFVVKKGQRKGSLSNIYDAMHTHCRNYSITLEVDGDDELSGRYVFKLFNAIYQTKNPGFAYSNHIHYSEEEEYFSKGYSEPYTPIIIENQNYRKVIQKFGHLRSFRTDLFLAIKEQDFRDANGQFFRAAGDEAFIFPILEMSCKNIEYIDEITYIYNAATGSNVHTQNRAIQQKNAIYIRLQKKYNCHPIYANQLFMNI